VFSILSLGGEEELREEGKGGGRLKRLEERGQSWLKKRRHIQDKLLFSGEFKEQQQIAANNTIWTTASTDQQPAALNSIPSLRL
jgi:hypothetical protein